MPCIDYIEDYSTKTREQLIQKYSEVCSCLVTMEAHFDAPKKVKDFLSSGRNPSDKYENLVNKATELLCSWVREVGVNKVKTVASPQLFNWVNTHIKQDQKRTEDCKNALVALAKGYGFDLDISSVNLK